MRKWSPVSLSKAGAKTVLLAHFDRPKGKRVPSMSLKPVLDDLAAFQRTLFSSPAVETLADAIARRYVVARVAGCLSA